MKKQKIPYLNLLPVLLIAFLLFKLVDTMEFSLSGIIAVVYGCVAYFVAGLIVAYLLNPALKFVEKWVVRPKDSLRVKHIKRGGVIAFLFLLLVGSIAVFVVAIIPTIRDGVNELTENIPHYAQTVEAWLSGFSISEDSILYGLVETWAEEGFGFLNSWLEGLDFSSIGTAVTTGVSNVATGFIRFAFGIIVSVYFLYSKEGLILCVKKLVYALFGQNRGDTIVETGRKINAIFLDFIVGRLLQSLIFFLIGLAVLVPMRIPLAPLLALFMAVMNLIPYIGPFLGGLISTLLVLLYSPIQAFWVLVYAVGIQILDNIFIGPKVMSEQVGISPLLVILGVTLGGTFGGVLGMFIGVPLVAVVKLVFYDPFVERKLREKEIKIEDTIE